MIIKQQQGFMEENMSNLASVEASVSSSTNNNRVDQSSSSLFTSQQHYFSQQNQSQDRDRDQDQDQDQELQPPPAKKKRNLPGNPDPEAEVIALSPKTLLATNRFVCEICNKGFQRDQNLQLHRRGHNLPWKLKQRNNKEVVRKKVYVCPETSCVHHDPSRALGDLTGIKKHFCRKHGEKKWKCDKCSKRYAVQSDWKAHSKVCGTREYRCDCGTLFSRRDSFITHRAFCDALAEETARAIITPNSLISNSVVATPSSTSHHLLMNLQQQVQFNNTQQTHHNSTTTNNNSNPLHAFPLKREQHHHPNLINTTHLPPWFSCPPSLVGPSPTQPIDHHHHHHHQHQLSSPSSSSSSIFHQDHPHHHHLQDPNPSHNVNDMSGFPSLGSGPGIGPYEAQQVAVPHMSATALLQKAAQMGATMSKPATTQAHNQGHVTDTTPTTTTTTTATTATNTTAGLFGLNLSTRDLQNPGPAQSSFLHDMMMNMNTALSSSFDHQDDAFGIAGIGGGGDTKGSGGGGGGNDGLTRDFLGLRPLSHSDIMTIAGLGNCLANNNSASHHHHHHHHQQQHDSTHKQPWQG